jgi:hypothetical protein
MKTVSMAQMNLLERDPDNAMELLFISLSS